MDIILIHTTVLIDNFELRSVSGSYHLVIRVGNILYTNFKPLFQLPNFPSIATGNKPDIFFQMLPRSQYQDLRNTIYM